MNPRALQALRGTVAASVATFVAMFGHVLAGGSAPRAVGILVPWTLAVLVSTVLIGRRLSLWRLAAVVAVSQTAFHALFVLGASGSAAHTGAHSWHVASGSIELAANPVAAAAPSVLMVLGHLAAAAVTTLALYRAEVVLEALAELVHRMVRVLFVLSASLPLPHVPAAVVATSPARGYRLDLESSRSRRGPPQF